MNATVHPVVVAVMVALACVPVPRPALTFEQRWEPVKELPPMIDKSPRELTFEERWAPVRRLPQMLPGKADRDESMPQGVVRVIPIARQVEGTIPGAAPILPTHAFVRDEPARDTAPVAVRVDRPPPVRTIRKASLDLCQRHGMRKQVTNNGRSWRCAR